MRLFLVDADGSEITNIRFRSVINKMDTGGAIACTKHDVDMASIGTMKKLLNQRVEVRKADGTTVIWEGFITDIKYDSVLHEWSFGGPEGLAALNDIQCGYNAALGSGVVTNIDDDDTPPVITDASQTFSNDLIGTEALFTPKKDDDISYEYQYPSANTAWIADAPAGGGTAADTTTTVWANMSTGGLTFVYLADANTRGNNYYALECEFDFANHATAQAISIFFQLKFSDRAKFQTDGSDLPEVWLYDDDASTWQTTDGNGAVGLGKLAAWNVSEFGSSTNANINTTLTIDNTDIGGYLDADGKLKVQITCGGPLTNDYIQCSFAEATMRYGVTFTAEANVYTIDAVSGSTFTVTGQTPYADNVRKGDAFRIGQDVDTVIPLIWQKAFISWIDYETDGATGLVECMDLRGSTVGNTLRRYTKLLNWELWQEVGWNIRLGATYDATALSLTHADFKHYSFDVHGREVAMKSSMYASGYWEDLLSPLTEGIYGFKHEVIMLNTLPSKAQANQTIGDFNTRSKTLKYYFTGLLDHDAGTDYSAIGLGKTITITLHTDKVVITNGVIDEISWSQTINGHLQSVIKVFI
jgi:hypothetical protein